MTLRGNIALDPGAPAFCDADVIVRLEDTSHADAPARAVAETVMHGVSWSGDPMERIKFALEVPASLPPGHRYELRVHVDTSRTREVTRGDFVTTQSYPITPGSSPEMSMRVKWLA